MDFDVRFSRFEILTGSGTLMLCLCFVCVFTEASAIEEEIGTMVSSAVKSDDLYWSSVEADGQTVVLTGAAPDVSALEAAQRRAEAVSGLTRVINKIKVIGQSGTCQRAIDERLSTSRIRFKSGRADVIAASHAVITDLAGILRACNARVEIAGHTDSDGDAEINLRLSQRRADRVAKSLVNLGVPAHRVRSEGYGETQPVSSNASSGGRKLNRRIEVRVLGVTA
jgi:outer membrane protein OmpA-like peptidoglycan-associated protein